MSTMEPQLTQTNDGHRLVKVTIPVAVNGDGEWVADGFFSRERRAAREECAAAAGECLLGNWVIHWVEASVPLPEGTMIAGHVEPDQEASL